MVVERGTQPCDVGAGIRQPVHVVDTQPGDPVVLGQFEDEPVRRPEDVRVLHAHADQAVDVEEPPVVPFVPTEAPVGRPIVLPVQQLLEIRAGDARRSGRHRLGIERERLAVQHDLALPGAGPHGGRTPAQHVAPRFGQAGHQNPPGVRRPVDVECRGELGRFTVAQDIPPPRVRRVRRHVVGHDVDEQPHAVAGQPVEEGAEPGRRAERRIEAARIDDVVAVGAARRGGEYRRDVEGLDAQLVEVVDQRRRGGEAEALQLQTIGRAQRSGARDRGAHPWGRSVWRNRRLECAVRFTASLRIWRAHGPGRAVLSSSSQTPGLSMRGKV